MYMYHFADAISASLFSKRCQCDRRIPPKLPTFTSHPKWQCDRSILNAKTKNEKRIRFSYLPFKNEKGIRFSFANLKTKKDFVFRSQIWKRKRKKRYIHGPWPEADVIKPYSVLRAQIPCSNLVTRCAIRFQRPSRLRGVVDPFEEVV